MLEFLAGRRGWDLELIHYDLGADRYLRTGETLPDPVFRELCERSDAILLGALGDPRVPDQTHARGILFGLRFKLDLYVNYRPVKLLADYLSPLREKGQREIDFLILRENTEGPYTGLGGVFRPGTAEELGLQVDLNTRFGVERIVRFAFQEATRLGRGSVVMADKSNALHYAHGIWQDVFWEVAETVPEIEARHLYIDTLAMEMVRAPEQFEVIVTSNLLGDIISDLGAQLQGGMGLAPSANLRPGGLGLFEPVHGSAPSLAGKGLANPLATILSVGLMLDSRGFPEEAGLVEEAVARTIQSGRTTPDLGGELTTGEVGESVREALSELMEAAV